MSLCSRRPIKMKSKTKHLLVLAAFAATVGFCTSNVSAQNRGSEEWRQRMMEGYRTSLEVKLEDDWKKIEPLIGKVLEARRATGGGFGGGGGRGGGGGGGRGDSAEQSNRNRGGQTNPE